MKTLTKHEKEILKDINGLPEPLQKKFAKIIRFLRAELRNEKKDENRATEEFLSVCGTWEDKRSIKEQLEDIYSHRESTNRGERIF